LGSRSPNDDGIGNRDLDLGSATDRVDIAQLA